MPIGPDPSDPTPENSTSKPRKVVKHRAGNGRRLGIESLEERILLSATWIDADTNEEIAGATTGDDIFQGSSGDDVANGLAGNDLLIGGDGDDSLFGDLGNDILRGGSGNDLLDGGAGQDIADFSESADGISVDLTLDGQAQFISADQGTDTITGIESVIGSDHDDVFAFTQPSDGAAYTVDGGAGSNTINLSGFDRASVTMGQDQLTVDLGSGQSFSIDFTNIDSIVLSDTTHDVGSDAIDVVLGTSEDVAVTSPDMLSGMSGASVTSFSQGTNGTVVHNGNGTFTYTPNDDFNGNDSFTYTIDDGAGGTSTGTVTVGISAVNDAPTVVGETITTNEDTPITTGNVLANDSDIEGDTLTISSYTQPTSGTVVHNGDGTFTYTPAANFNGSDSFTYTVSDGNGGTTVGTVNIGVNAVNDDPIAVGESISTTEDTAITTGNVLNNDADVDGDVLSVDSFTQGANGTVAYNGDGTFTYTPNADYHGTDSFTYTVTDGNGGTSTTTINVTISSVEDAPRPTGDVISTDEDTPITTANLLANDSDPDGDAIAMHTYTQPANGTVAYNGDGTFTYIPDTNFNGTDSFTYTIGDGKGNTGTTTVQINVGAVNDNPIAEDDAALLMEDAPTVSPNVLANDTDIDGDTLFVESFQQPSHGSVTYNGDGTFTYTPDANYHGSDAFTYTVSDGNGGTSTATMFIVANPVNDAPEAEADIYSTNEDAPVTTGNVLSNDFDVDGDTLAIYNFTQPSNGSVSYNGDGTFIYTPDGNFNGSDTFTYTVVDGNGGTDTGTVTIDVAAVNDNPNAVSNSASTAEDQPVTTINVLGNDTDIDGDSLSIISFTQPGNGSVAHNGDGTFDYTPNANYNGGDSFTYTIDDGNGGTSTGTVNLIVTAVNDDPTPVADTYGTSSNTPVTTGNVLSNDVDIDGDSLVLYDFTQPSNGSVIYNGDGTFTYTPSNGFSGTDTFTYSVTDVNGATATATVSINVNDAPTAVDDVVTTPPDTPITTGNLLANDTDPNGDTLTITSFTQPSNGTVVNHGDGTFTYTPDSGFHGSDSFTYTTSDGNGGTSTATVTVGVNTPPTAVDDAATGSEDSTINIGNVLSNDSDADGDSLSAGSIVSFTQPEYGTVVRNGPTFSYTPDPDYFGTDSFTYTIEDGYGGTSTATVNLTVTPVQEGPTANPDEFTTSTGSPVSLGNILANDTDPDGDTLTIDSYTSPSNGSVTVLGDGTLVYTPDGGFHGVDSFSYTISDGQGGTDSTTVTITVNDDPTAVDDSATTNEDTALTTGNVLSNDSDPNGESVDVVSFSQPTNGTVVYNNDGTFTYTPDADFNGSDSFAYTISDDSGGTSTAMVHITVSATADAPDAANDSASTYENTDVTIDVLANDTDVDGDSISVTGFTQPTNGTVVNNGDGTFTYTPDVDYIGNDAFTYTITDATGATSTATVNVAVNDSNVAPDLADDSVATTEDQSVTTPNVLANDSDPNGDPLTLDSFTQPANGTVVSNGDGTFEYTPNANFTGADSFTYTVTDGEGGSSTATVNITVVPENDAPVAVLDTVTTDEDTPITTANVLANDTDAEGHTLAVYGYTQPGNGSVTYNNDGTFTYTPAANYNGSDSFTYTVTDGHGGLTTGTVQININPVNDAPTVVTDTATTAEDMSVVITNPLANDSDIEGDSLTLVSFTQPANGTVVDNGDGTFTYTPDANFNGTDSFTYTADDGSGDTSVGTVQINVTAVNDAPDAVDDSIVTDEDTSVVSHNVLANDSDVEGHTISIQDFSQASHGTVKNNGDGTFTYTPFKDYFGSDSFTYTIGDGYGTSTTATINVTVNPVNDLPEPEDDVFTTNEDTPFTTGSVLDNDTDVDPDTLTVLSHTQPANGTVTYNGDGTFSYTPNDNFHGVETFAYTLDDGNGGQVSAMVTINVKSVNDLPEAVTDSLIMDEDTTATTVNVLANDTDLDNDTLAIASYSQPANGSLVYNQDGTFTYTPDPDFFGTDSFTYNMVDGNGGSDVGVVNITVNNVNDAVIAVNDSATVAEDNAVTTGNVLANDIDVDGDTLSITAFSQPANGSVVHNGDGTFTYTPNAHFNGTDSFTYTVTDGNGTTDTGVVTITVTPVNDGPVANDDLVTTNEDTPVYVSAYANDTDIDGHSLSVTSYSQPAHGSVTYYGYGVFRYTPDANYNGTDSFTYNITDGHGGTSSATISLTINAVNDAPITVGESITVDEDSSVTTPNVLANDSDVEGDELSLAAFTDPSNGSIVYNGDGTFTYTPDANFNGVDAFTYTVSDGNGGLTTETVSVTVGAVNDAPVAFDDALTTTEDAAITMDVLANDTDIDGDSLSVISYTQPSNGTLSHNGAGSFTYEPDANYNGTDSFTYTVSDGAGGTSTATVNLTVTSVNDAPITVGESITVDEDSSVTTPNVLANDSDVDGDALTVAAYTSPSNGSLVYNGDGTFTYTPDANFHGSDSFTYTVSDGNGGLTTESVSITVESVNDAPAAFDDALTTTEDAAITMDVLANDTDIDGDSLSVISYTQPSNGTLTHNGAGSFTYEPDANYNGTDSFTYTVSDGAGGTSTATVNLTVTPVNDAPVAQSDSFTTQEDTPITTGNVLSNDSDVEGDALAVAAYTSPSNGSLSYNGDGTFTYTPHAHFHGSDSFTYTVSDGNGGLATQTVTIDVAAVNDDPNVVGESITTDEDTPITTPNLLANDSDVDGDTLTIESFTQPTNGTVVSNGDGTFTYTPDAHFHGSDAFTYTVSDGHGGLVSQAVSITVASVQDAVVAADDFVTTPEDTPITTTNLLANDTDADGDTLTVTTYSQPAHGTVVYNGDGTFTYTPDSHYHGSDEFTYTVTDGQGSQSIATVNLTVTSVNDAPDVQGESVSTNEDTPITIPDVLSNDFDLDGHALSIESFTQPANGAVQHDGNGTFVYTPDANYHGADAFTYTVTDSNGASVVATVDIQVNSVNDLTGASADVFQTSEDTPLTTGNVLANDTDVDGDVLGISAFTQPEHGTVVSHGDGTFTYTPDANFNGTDAFTYTVSDGQGGLATQTVTIQVQPVNDGPVAVSDTITTNEDTSITTANVLDNDTDLDADTLSVASFTQPEHGQVVSNGDGTFTYTPDANYHGSDAFTYTITDGNGASSTATVDIIVESVNDNPTAANDELTTDQHVPITFDALVNDSDLEGDDLTVIALQSPAHGKAVINDDGTITYTPNFGYAGPDSFTYTISDGQGGTAQATVAVTVKPSTETPEAKETTPPTAADDSQQQQAPDHLFADDLWTGDEKLEVLHNDINLEDALATDEIEASESRAQEPDDQLVEVDLGALEEQLVQDVADEVRETVEELRTDWLSSIESARFGSEFEALPLEEPGHSHDFEYAPAAIDEDGYEARQQGSANGAASFVPWLWALVRSAVGNQKITQHDEMHNGDGEGGSTQGRLEKRRSNR